MQPPPPLSLLPITLVDSRENEDSTIAQDIMLLHHIANLNQQVLQYQENDGVKRGDDGVKHLSKTLQRVYHAIVNKPEIISIELMESLNISESTVTRSTRELKKLGFIKHDGSDKTGKWIILR